MQHFGAGCIFDGVVTFAGKMVDEDDLVRELSFGANWFFAGHRNKLTFDLSFLDREAAKPGERQETRVRLQWDVSF